MAGKQNGNGGRAMRRKRGRRSAPVPRGPGNGCVVRRAYAFGNLAGAAADQGYQIGVTPSAVLDWSSYTAVWKRFRVLSATVHLVISGQNDATPVYPTAYIYHDVVSAGAPATILDALVQKNRRILSFGTSNQHRSFTFRPLPWTDGTFQLTMPRADAYWCPVGGFAPFTSAAMWFQGYNTTVNSPIVNVTVELVIHFDSPQ